MKTAVSARPPESMAKFTGCGGGVNHTGIGHGTVKVCQSSIDAWQTVTVVHDRGAKV
jgi:hypothetical protein